MSKGQNQKWKMLALLQIFYVETGERKMYTARQLCNRLEERWDIVTTARRVKLDILELKDKGIEINVVKAEGMPNRYYLANHVLSVAEGKYLIDTLQASNFISQKLTRKLIKTIKMIVGEANWDELKRYEFITGRPKPTNMYVFDNVEVINEAMFENRQIKFKYYKWDEKIHLVEKHPGKVYEVSPLGLVISDERYYLIGYDSNEKKRKHYRVDKIGCAAIDKDRPREGTNLLSESEMHEYAKMNFSMFADNKPVDVILSVDKDKVGLLVDRFGTDISLLPDLNDKNRLQLRTKIYAESQFFGWLLGQRNEVRLVSPQSVIDKMVAETEEFLQYYK